MLLSFPNLDRLTSSLVIDKRILEHALLLYQGILVPSGPDLVFVRCLLYFDDNAESMQRSQLPDLLAALIMLVTNSCFLESTGH